MNVENLNGRVLQGVVVSDKMDQGIVVKVEYRKPHPVVGKFVKSSKKFAAHDPQNECGEGDEVTIVECPPISKRKTWHLLKVISKAK